MADPGMADPGATASGVAGVAEQSGGSSNAGPAATVRVGSGRRAAPGGADDGSGPGEPTAAILAFQIAISSASSGT
ncbi:hypothetical protein GCM10012284_39310 [Mangrovihabitans endophyticus]|uniref:Uncharacterized protein n=1 Tax=Mangrovihabitans endophyticus TaxID=1751298 RepID=A0A8J3C0S9_9ACTN|nr:hypothetical protein GCM10012284_39310 [Mangrovihabitans endophyticus]